MTEVRLAPMCGITDSIYRTICAEFGCDLAYTEMISAMGYLCAPEQRAVKELMKRGAGEPKLILQLFGKDPDIISEAAHRMETLGLYNGIDLNMGCPARKVACSGEGSGLMRTPEIAERIIRKTVSAVKMPVSVKMRIGWDNEHINALEFAEMAQNAGACEITIHGRTREQQYSGKADWEMIRIIKEKLRIPVIGNGDVFTAEDAVSKIGFSNVNGIMIGRGALGNPWIFRNIKLAMSGQQYREPDPEERRQMIHRHYSMMLESKPERIAVREMRKHIGWYIHGLRGASKVRAKINLSPDADETLSLLDHFFDELQESKMGDY